MSKKGEHNKLDEKKTPPTKTYVQLLQYSGSTYTFGVDQCNRPIRKVVYIIVSHEHVE